MFKDFIKQADITIYPLISLSIFFIFFVLMTIWVFTVKKEYLKTMSRLPLNAGETNQDETDEKIDTQKKNMSHE